MGRARRATPCSCPGCDGKSTYDLTLTHREYGVYRGTRCRSTTVVRHVYLCSIHYKDVLDWMDAYEGKERDADNRMG